MFEILRKSLTTGVVTTAYPEIPPEVDGHTRGKPAFDFANWKDARPAAAVCPTGAVKFVDAKDTREVSFDLALCTFCGLCAEVDSSIQMTNACELAARSRAELLTTAQYQLRRDGTQGALIAGPSQGVSTAAEKQAFEVLGSEVKKRIQRLLGRSLHIREVDAGSCNGCEIEIIGLNSPVYDVERFGIHFVASPRHADMLLVTGPVTRNMQLALRKTYEAMPDPRLVVAVGTCGCTGGIYGQNYATVGGVDKVVPVDVYIPGCPPNPHALLHGILLAIGRAAKPGSGG